MLVCLAGGGLAQAQTVLNLSATGRDVTVPDEMVAALTVQAKAPTAAAAQAMLNRMMTQALAAARAVDGVAATTGGYNVAEFDDQNKGTKPVFQANQELNLTMPAPSGVPPASFTDLAGKLQEQGLLMETIGGALSAKGEDAARAAATSDGIGRLKTQAGAVAKALGDTVAGINSLTINSNDIAPVAPRMMMAMAAAAPPQVAPGPMIVTVNIDAVIALKPLSP
jgi:uncharacterized protein YggE